MRSAVPPHTPGRSTLGATLEVRSAPLCLCGSCPVCLGFSLLPQNTGRTEAWKILSPQGGPWDSVARILPNGSLLLPAIGIVDEGTFRCRATNRQGKEVKSNYRVRVYRKGPRLSHFACNKKSLPLPPTLTLHPGVWTSDLRDPSSCAWSENLQRQAYD